MAWHRRIWCFVRYGYICCLFDAEPAPGRWYPEEPGLKRSGDTVYRELPWGERRNDCGTESRRKPARRLPMPGSNTRVVKAALSATNKRLSSENRTIPAGASTQASAVR